MIDTSALAFPKPNCVKDRRRKQRVKKGDAKRAQEEVLLLDFYTCMDLTCKCHEKLNPLLGGHHINPKGRGVVDNSMENLITLCNYVAHIRVTSGYDDEDGNRISAAQAMINILEQHIGKPYWRWDGAYVLLRRQLAA